MSEYLADHHVLGMDLIPHLHIFTQDEESASSNLGEKRVSFPLLIDWFITLFVGIVQTAT